MVDLYKGVYQWFIHDELAISFNGDKEMKEKIVSIMESSIEMSVPSKVM